VDLLTVLDFVQLHIIMKDQNFICSLLSLTMRERVKFLKILFVQW